MTEDDLVSAIHLDPDSDGPRMVYADWLQSQGDPLGEYISMSLRYERLAVDDPARVEFHTRFRELDTERMWFQRFRQYVSTERGMVAGLSLYADQVVPELIANLRGTLIRDLSIDGDALNPRALGVLRAALPKMRLRKLRLGCYIAPAEIVALLALTPDLEELVLGQTVIGDDGVRVLATAPLPRLARLTIRGYWQERRVANAHQAIGDAGAAALASSRGWPVLRELGLTNWAIGPDGAAALVDGRLALAALDLGGNPIGPAGVVAIAHGAAALESLGIAGVGLDDTAVAVLAGTPALARLRRLELAASLLDSGLTPAQLATLVASPHLARDLVVAVDGGALGMQADVSYDGVSGQPAYSSWVGEVPAELAARFRIEVAGYPLV